MILNEKIALICISFLVNIPVEISETICIFFECSTSQLSPIKYIEFKISFKNQKSPKLKKLDKKKDKPNKSCVKKALKT